MTPVTTQRIYSAVLDAIASVGDVGALDGSDVSAALARCLADVISFCPTISEREAMISEVNATLRDILIPDLAQSTRKGSQS